MPEIITVIIIKIVITIIILTILIIILIKLIIAIIDNNINSNNNNNNNNNCNKNNNNSNNGSNNSIKGNEKHTYVEIMTVPNKMFKKTSYRQTLLLQVLRRKGAKNRDLHTLSSTLSPKGAIVFKVLLQ